MSIRLRFTITLALVGVILFGAYALVAYRSADDDLRTETVRETRIIGRSLDTALGNALRDRQREDIEDTLNSLEALEPVTGLVLGTIAVSRPIAKLAAGMRSVREGDFRTKVPAARRDEIGELVNEFNAMAAALAEARRRTESETELRARMEQGLQRADKLITIGQLSAGLAHEIGSPLQVMSGRASTLLD